VLFVRKEEIIEKFSRERIKTLIASNNKKLIRKLFNEFHYADIAEVLGDFTLNDQIKFVKNISMEEAAEVISNMESQHKVDIIKTLKFSRASDLLEEMDADDAVDILNDLSPDRVVKILAEMEREDAEDISELLTFDERSAGGLMNTEYIVIPEKLTVNQAIKRIREQDPPEDHAFAYVYVVDGENRLVGYASLRDLMLADPKSMVKKIRHDNVVSVPVDLDQEEVAEKFAKYDLIALPVVDHKDRLVGVITLDDIVDVITEESTEDLYKFTGATFSEENEAVEGKFAKAAMFRLPWLLITLSGGFVISYIINSFSPTLDKLPMSLALILGFVPMLTGMGGNVGTQSSSITVRGLATGHIRMDKVMVHITREILVGLSIGMILGLIVSVVSYYWQANHYIGLIVGIAMWFNVSFAATLGAVVPILFKKIGIDPAIASAPFISTSIDILGLINYFFVVMVLVNLFF